MGRVIAFSEFATYYELLRGRDGLKQGTIIDTNILIALTYEVNSNNEEALQFFENSIGPEQEKSLRLFTTVNLFFKNSAKTSITSGAKQESLRKFRRPNLRIAETS